jgi:hypothetical protein
MEELVKDEKHTFVLCFWDTLGGVARKQKQLLFARLVALTQSS